MDTYTAVVRWMLEDSRAAEMRESGFQTPELADAAIERISMMVPEDTFIIESYVISDLTGELCVFVYGEFHGCTA